MSGITIEDDQLNKIMARAVITYLTPDKRDELLLKAVTEFFSNKEKNGYDKRPEIERAFGEVIGKVGREVAETIIRSDASIMKKIHDSAYKGINQVLDSDKLAKEIAAGFQRSLNIHL